MANTLTPEQIYNRIVEDSGRTPADDLAKELGLKSHGMLMQVIGKHLMTVFTQTGEMKPYPQMNIPLPELKKSKTANTAGRRQEDSKLQIGPAKLKELGDFDQVSNFEILVEEREGEKVLVLKPLARFGSTTPAGKSQSTAKVEKAEPMSSTPVPTSPSTSTSSDESSATATSAPEVQAAIPSAVDTGSSSTESDDSGLGDDFIPNVVTPASKVPSVTAEEEEEDALNNHMI